MPPSLWLSAFMATSTYLTVVMRVSVQMMSERAPRTTSWDMVASPPLPEMIAFRVYMGLVPMSPYTTPRVTRIIAAERGMPAPLTFLPARDNELICGFMTLQTVCLQKRAPWPDASAYHLLSVGRMGFG